MRYRYWTTTIFSKKSTTKNKSSFIIYGILLLVLGLPAYGQTERWVFRYNGPADSADCAFPVVYGEDNNIYVAGYSQGVGTGRDFIVISLNKDTGDTNWIYRYNGPADSADCANSIVYGLDGNLYAAGYSRGSGTGYDFTVISLTTAGSERWVYRYNGPVDSNDVASSIVYGNDGNLYVTGWSDAIEDFAGYPVICGRFTIISLTQSGNDRWIYRYTGSLGNRGEGHSLVCDIDSNIYGAGFIQDTVGRYFAVISLTPSGVERFVWTYGGGWGNQGHSLVYGGDSNVYAAGVLSWNYFTVISLTSDGGDRWVYSLPPGNSSCEGSANSVVYSLDSNIYAAGVTDTTSEEPFANPDFTVVSLTTSGGERWVYRYDGPAHMYDYAFTITFGVDSNVYAGGTSFQVDRDFTVISLTSLGSERWVYLYSDSGWIDRTSMVVFGGDGYIYASGFVGASSYTFGDFLVVSLNPAGAIIECHYQTIKKYFNIIASTFQKKNLEFSLTLPNPNDISVSLFSVTGEEILSWQAQAPVGFSQYKKNLWSISAGAYILRIETGDKRYVESKKLIFIK